MTEPTTTHTITASVTAVARFAARDMVESLTPILLAHGAAAGDELIAAIETALRSDIARIVEAVAAPPGTSRVVAAAERLVDAREALVEASSAVASYGCDRRGQSRAPIVKLQSEIRAQQAYDEAVLAVLGAARACREARNA